MKIKVMTLFAATMVLFSNCTQKEIDAPVVGKTYELTAIMEGEDQTRSEVTDGGYFTWAAGDAISVFTDDGNKVKGKISSGEGTPSATFQYTITSTGVEANGYAVYPHHKSHTLSDGALSVTLPAEYDLNSNTSNTNAIMLALPSGNEASDFRFQHLGAVIRFAFKNVPAGVDNFVLSLGGKKLNGVFEVDTENLNVSTSETENESEQSVTLRFTALTETSDLTLCVPVPVGNYVGMKASLNAGETEKWSYSSDDSSNDIKRRDLKLATVTINSVTGDIDNSWDGSSVAEPEFEESSNSYIVGSAAELAWIAQYVNAGNTLEGITVKLAADIDLGNKAWTPIGFNSSDVAGSETYFAGTFDGDNHTISNLKIGVTDKGGVGLFGAVHNASFKNFTLTNVDIKAIESEDDPVNLSGAQGKSGYIVGGHMGAVAGYDAKAGNLSFDNVHVSGLIKIEGETRVAQGQRIGGVIGGKGSSVVSFNNVSVKGSEGSYIKGYCSTAGVMGQYQSTGTFTDVHTDIDVYAVTFGVGGIVGIARQGSTFTDCSSAGDITLDASKTQLSSYSANYPYRVGGIAGCWSESSTGVLTLTGCSYTGTLTSIDRDGNAISSFDYAGYVGRGYTLKNCAGSKVIIDDKSYVQADNATYGIYIVDDVYEIGTLAAIKWFANQVNSGSNYFTGKTVRLSNDIDLNNEEWTPVGSAAMDHGFCGNFDGNSKTIKNLKIADVTLDSEGYAYAGLFGVTEGTDAANENYIKDFTIENVNISTTGHIVAAAIAYPYYTIVENITVKGDVTITGGDYTAGVLAYTRRCVNAENLTVTAESGSGITGAVTVGGVISDIQMNGGLTANYSNFNASGLTITATENVGGISGIISGQTLDGAMVENVAIVCDDVRKGTVSGALGETSTIKNIVVTNVTGATNEVGATYDGGAAVVKNGDVFVPAGN